MSGTNFNTVKAFAYRLIANFWKQKMYIFAEVLFWPLMFLVAFGLLIKTFSADPTVINYILAASITWRITTVFQQSVNMGFLLDYWNETMRQTWVAPFHLKEYVIGNSMLGLLSGSVTFLVSLVVAWLAFGFSYQPLWLFVLTIVIMAVWGCVIGVLILATTVRVGEGATRLAWVITDIIVLLSGVFYPITMLPVPIQFVSHFLPSTFLFQMLRVHSFSPVLMAGSAVMVVAYLVLGMALLRYSVNHAKKVGRLVRFY